MVRTVLAGLGVTCMLAIAAPASAQDASVKTGMKVYADNKCQMCHSIEGKGNKKFPLDGVGSKLTEAEIREWIVNPKEAAKKAKSEAKPPMPAYPKLSKAELDGLVAYMMSLKK